jgi:hypothetical protein
MDIFTIQNIITRQNKHDDIAHILEIPHSMHEYVHVRGQNMAQVLVNHE